MKTRRRIKMSLHAQPLEPIPELTSQIAHASFPKGTLVMHLRDALGSIYQDTDFADLFPKRGRAAEADAMPNVVEWYIPEKPGS
jgi:transposase